ncbi:MAG: DUF2889 domain-containing protein [Rhodospirillaceae bacterium]|nr:MAG: DUF2889 domain-containing protein [Rhodospirillaceae bacterium]
MATEPLRNSAGHAPPRPHGSARRTSSIDTSWPEGRAGNMRLVGRARDIVTPRSGGAPISCAEDGFTAYLKSDRTIVAIDSDPARPALERLVGQRGGNHLRYVLDEVMPEERRNATPLHLILDDISGASLIAAWAWSQWNPGWLTEVRAAMTESELAKMMTDREGICTGFAPGSSALDPNLMNRSSTGGAPTTDLRHPEDPEGWHAFTVQENVGMRRARRIDVTMGNVIEIDAAFQDSASTPDGSRRALHEYRLAVTADPVSFRILSIQADPRVLPFAECPSATLNLRRLLGTPLSEMREKVIAELKGTAGCTHLNDALRALAEAPALLGYLRHNEGGSAAARRAG